MNDQPDRKVALLCIDMQRLGCEEAHVSLEHHGAVDSADDTVELFVDALDRTVIPNVQRLQKYFRANDMEVIHTRIRSLTHDGRDRSLEHKRLDIHVEPDSEMAGFVEAVAPAPDEIVIDKTASGVFVSTNIEYVLRNLNITTLCICGVYTNECISSAARSAADLGFEVFLISDATAAITPELHKATLLIVDGRYGEVVTAESMLDMLAG